jgi:hypothetical protein
MATLALNSWLWVRRLLNSFGEGFANGESPSRGRYSASKANDGTCLEKPVHLNLHKIGRNDNLPRRMKQLQPDEVMQVLETDRSRDLEHELHEQFKAKRLPQTEYFRLDEPEVNMVRLALGWEPDGPVNVPPLHELNTGIAKARLNTSLIGTVTAVASAALTAEVFTLGADANLLEACWPWRPSWACWFRHGPCCWR